MLGILDVALKSEITSLNTTRLGGLGYIVFTVRDHEFK